MTVVVSYRLVLPRPWVRVPVGQGTESRVRRLVEAQARAFPKEVSPDEVGPWKRNMERQLVTKIKSSAEYGGIDFYLPADAMGGILVGASFVVSGISPLVRLPNDTPGDAAVGAVLAELIGAQPNSRLVSVGGQAWVRTQAVLEPDEAKAPGVDVPMVAVSYVTALPDDPQKWVLVEFSGTGDGDPRSDATVLIVELFDAIMTTWRWISAGDARWDEPEPGPELMAGKDGVADVRS